MENLVDTIGNTPLLKLAQGVPVGGADIYAKVERFNPGGSIKDRVAVAMIDAAEQKGRLAPGRTVLEPVAGNTGIALALVCRLRGYSLILTMPEDYMPERRYILECCGTRIETTPAEEGIAGAIRRAHVIQKEHPDYFMPDHFSNPAQVEAHHKGLMQEILTDLDGVSIDAFVGCVGTGSSLTAIAEALQPEGTKIIAVEPAASPFLSEGKSGRHAIPGIGFGFAPETLKRELIDQIETITDEEALKGSQDLAAKTGLLAGLSSGANYHVAKKVSQELGGGKNVLTIFYDGGERYLSLKRELSNKEIP